jgi:hypothetical protein
MELEPVRDVPPSSFNDHVATAPPRRTRRSRAYTAVVLDGADEPPTDVGSKPARFNTLSPCLLSTASGVLALLGVALLLPWDHPPHSTPSYAHVDDAGTFPPPSPTSIAQPPTPPPATLPTPPEAHSPRAAGYSKELSQPPCPPPSHPWHSPPHMSSPSSSAGTAARLNDLPPTPSPVPPVPPPPSPQPRPPPPRPDNPIALVKSLNARFARGHPSEDPSVGRPQA